MNRKLFFIAAALTFFAELSARAEPDMARVIEINSQNCEVIFNKNQNETSFSELQKLTLRDFKVQSYDESRRLVSVGYYSKIEGLDSIFSGVMTSKMQKANPFSSRDNQSKPQAFELSSTEHSTQSENEPQELLSYLQKAQNSSQGVYKLAVYQKTAKAINLVVSAELNCH